MKNNRAPLLDHVKLDDTSNMLNMQHIIPTWKDGIIQTSPVAAINRFTSSFVHYFIAICEFKLDLQSGNIL